MEPTRISSTKDVVEFIERLYSCSLELPASDGEAADPLQIIQELRDWLRGATAPFVVLNVYRHGRRLRGGTDACSTSGAALDIAGRYRDNERMKEDGIENIDVLVLSNVENRSGELSNIGIFETELEQIEDALAPIESRSYRIQSFKTISHAVRSAAHVGRPFALALTRLANHRPNSTLETKPMCAADDEQAHALSEAYNVDGWRVMKIHVHQQDVPALERP